MLIENEFTVKRPVDEVWSYLLDVERIAPCMPGAELTETIDDHTWNGKVNMAFGPVKMAFAGSVSMEERDDAAHRVALKAKGTEQKGKGAANATVTSWLEPIDGGTKVSMQADITLTGAAAQMSRGLLPEVSRRLTQQFADCLEESLAANASPAAASPAGASAPTDGVAASSEAAAAQKPGAPVAAKPVGGIRLGLAAIWSMIAGFFRKLFGGGAKEAS
ncbi:MAG TPA: SRPBCC family protein [Actinomycetota bacterium]|nr:SRPBCC family protein [Actinomycetota bacterium]